MSLTNEQIEQILAGAPDGATHYAQGIHYLYFKILENGEFFLHENGRWVADYESDFDIDAPLSLLKEILALRKRVEELERQHGMNSCA